jgi:thymidylate synthase
MNTLDKQYQELLQTILDYGVEKKDRTGTGTKSIFGYTIRHNMKHGFPLLTTKKMYFKGIVTELLWFLRGDTNIKYLVDNDCHIWDGDAFKNYISKTNEFKGDWPDTMEEFINKIKTDDEFAKKWGELGPVYGKQWRSWERYGYRGVQNGALDCGLISMEDYKKEMYIDQITNLINDLKTNPDSRRLMVSAWNVGEIDQMTLPPCHYGFQVYTRELSLEERVSIWDKKFLDSVKPEESMDNLDLDHDNIPTRAISLMWNQRSVDTFLGLPFNIASYGLLLEIIAKEVNMVPDELIGNLGDTHLYLNHIEQAKEQIGRELSLEERHQLALPIWKEKYGPLVDMMVITNVDNTPYKIPKRTREPYPLPKLMICDDMRRTDGFNVPFDELDHSLIKLIDYQSHPSIKAPLSN